MKIREKNIIDFMVESSSWVTGEELSRIFNVSTRTIRSDIKSINNHYNCELVISNKRYGYKVDKEVLNRNHKIESFSFVPQNAEERCKWILRNLLLRDKLNVKDIEDEIYISEFSINNEIKKIKKFLENYPELKILREQGYIYLIGKSVEKRKLYKDLLDQEIKGDFTNLNQLAKLWKSFDLIEVFDIFKKSEVKFHYYASDDLIPILMLHACISIDCLMNHSCIFEYPLQDRGLHSSIEYCVARDFFKNVSKQLNVEYNDAETERFAKLMIGHRLEADSQSDLVEMVNELLMQINEKFGIDFSDDESLKNGLYSHLQMLMIRLQQRAQLNNNYLKEIKKNYPLIFEMGVYAGNTIAKILHEPLNESEMATLSLHFGAAYERQNTNKKYRGIAVIPHNKSLATACIHKIQEHFSKEISEIHLISYFEESIVKSMHPDFILSTLPLVHQLDVPTQIISLFVSNEDESHLLQMFTKLNKKQYHKSFVQMAKMTILPELCFFHQNMKTPEDAIHFLSSQLFNLGLAQETYEESVLNREELSSTSFAQGFAVPHSLNQNTKRSCISIMTLNQAITWGNFQVKLVILLSIKESDHQLLQIFFDWLTGLVTNKEKLLHINDLECYEDLMKYILED